MYSDDHLSSNESLFSTNCAYEFELEGDYLYIKSFSGENENHTHPKDIDGHFSIDWQSGDLNATLTAVRPLEAEIDEDGNLTLLDSLDQVLWAVTHKYRGVPFFLPHSLSHSSTRTK